MSTQAPTRIPGRRPSAKERERIARRLTADVGPTTEGQSGGRWVRWSDQAEVLGQPFDVTNIPLSKLHQMRRDPMIAFALLFVKVPLVRASWFMKSENAQAAAFVDNALRRIYARFIFAYTNSLDFGFSPIVKRFQREFPDWTYHDPRKKDSREKKVWPDKVIPAVTWKPFMPLAPDDVEPFWTPDGEFGGMYYRTAHNEGRRDFPGQSRGTDPERPDVPLERSLWATNEKDSVFGSLWGYPRVAYAYPYWWSYWFRFALSDRHFEKDADPAAQVYYPAGEAVDEDGNVIDYEQIAMEIGENIRSGATVTMPSSLVRNEADDKPTNTREWEIRFLEGNGNFQAFTESFTYLDIAKLRSIMVPEQAFMEGRGGTSSRNVAEQLGDIFFESQAVLMSEIDDHLNRFVIPQLVEANFGPGITVEKVTRGFAQQDIDLAKQLITLVGQADPNQLEVDVREILGQMGIPLLTPEQLREKEAALEREAAAQNPSPFAGFPGFAEVGEDGKYIQGRERIALGELPPTVHYEDDDIRATMDDLRDTAEDHFMLSYNRFAEWLEDRGDSIRLAEGDEDDNAAERILKEWVESGRATALKARRVAGFIRSIMDTAGKREIARHRLGDVDWSMDNPDVVRYANKRAGELVTKIDETSRRELRRFIAKELRQDKSPADIAKDIRAHFSRFPGWKSERLARTEAMLAYNNAALAAYKAAGVKRVRARDAAITERSDPDCIARNGKVFTLAEAMKEQQKEHPNGTLSWQPIPRLTPTTLAIDYEAQPVFNGEPARAFFDEDGGRVVLAEDITDAEAFLFLEAVAARLPIPAGPDFTPDMYRRVWNENKHVRDFKGRFAKKGGAKKLTEDEQRKLAKEMEDKKVLDSLKNAMVQSYNEAGIKVNSHRRHLIDHIMDKFVEDPAALMHIMDMMAHVMHAVGFAEEAHA